MSATALIESAVDSELTDVEKRILSYARQNPIGFSEASILNSVVGRRSSKIQGIRKLVRIEMLVRCGEGTKSVPFVYKAIVEQNNKSVIFEDAIGNILSPDDLEAYTAWISILLRMRDNSNV